MKEIQKAKKHLALLFPDKNIDTVLSSLATQSSDPNFSSRDNDLNGQSRKKVKQEPRKGEESQEEYSKRQQKDRAENQERGQWDSDNEIDDTSDLQSLNEGPKVNKYKKPFQCSLELLKKDHPGLYNPKLLERRKALVGPPIPLTQREILLREEFELEREGIEVYGRQLQRFRKDRVEFLVHNPNEYFNLDKYYAEEAKLMKRMEKPIGWEELQKYRSQRLARQRSSSASIRTIREEVLGLESSYVNEVQELKKFFRIDEASSQEKLSYYNVAVKVEKAMHREIKRVKRFNGEYQYKGEKDFVKLTNVKRMLWAYIQHGYTIEELRKVLGAHVSKNRYKNFMMGCLRISIRLVEKYIREHCRRGELVYQFKKDTVSLACPIFHIRQWFEPVHAETYFKLVRIIFQVQEEGVTQLTKKEIVDFYYECEKKLARKENMRQQLRRSAPVKPVPVDKIPYIPYEHPGEKYIKRQPFEKELPDQIVEKFFHPELTYWTEQFQVEFMLMILKWGSLQTVKDKLEELYQYNAKVRQELTTENFKLKGEKIHRKALKYMQLCFRQWCFFRNITRLNFNEMKFLKLNDYEKRTFTTRRDGIEVKQMLIDFYLNNVYRYFSPQRKRYPQPKILMTTEDLINEPREAQRYRLNYISYTLEALINYLESKKHLRYICKEPQEARLEEFYLDPILNEKWLQDNANDCLLKEELEPGKITKNHQRAIAAFIAKKRAKLPKEDGDKLPHKFKGFNYPSHGSGNNSNVHEPYSVEQGQADFHLQGQGNNSREQISHSEKDLLCNGNLSPESLQQFQGQNIPIEKDNEGIQPVKGLGSLLTLLSSMSEKSGGKEEQEEEFLLEMNLKDLYAKIIALEDRTIIRMDQHLTSKNWFYSQRTPTKAELIKCENHQNHTPNHNSNQQGNISSDHRQDPHSDNTSNGQTQENNESESFWDDSKSQRNSERSQKGIRGQTKQEEVGDEFWASSQESSQYGFL